MRITMRIALLGLLLAACSGPPEQAVENTAAPPTEVVMVAPTEAAVVEPTEAAVDAPTLAATVAATELPAATEAAAAPTETRVPRLSLEATDPSTVSLAAGKPQLVEFFAFW